MGSEDSEMDLILTQINIGGFDNAKMLSEYLEEQVGQVWRCRLKTSSTPPESYPSYDIDEERVQRMNNYIKVEPHAFVHFASSGSARAKQDMRVIKCNFKIQFLPREINEIKECKDFGSLVILSQLASSPLVFNRTADDIEESVAFDILDDDDQWIRTTDITCSGAIGRFNTYHISIRPHNGPIFNEVKDYFHDNRVPMVKPCNGQRLRVRHEPAFGVSMSKPFFCFQNLESISFQVLFLVNAVLHKGIVNQHQMTNEFFNLLRLHQEGVNVAALKHIFSYRKSINDAIKKLAHIQAWLLINPDLIGKSEESDDVVEVRRLVITPTKHTVFH